MIKLFEKFNEMFLPKTFSAYYNKGLELFEKNELDKAIDFFEMAANMPNRNPAVLYNLGLAHQKLNQFQDAIIFYQAFLSYEPEDYDTLYNLGLAYYENSNFSKAIENFERCLKIKPNGDNYKNLILAYIDNNQFDKILEITEELFQDYDKNRELFITAVKTIESKNKFFNKDYFFLDKAIELYSKMIEKNPLDTDAYLAISIAYAKQAKWDLAVFNCLKALDIEPKSCDINNQMGLIYYCNNKMEDAIIYYEESLKIKECPKVYSNLAYAYEKARKTEKAIEVFKLLLKNYPEIKTKNEIKNHIRILQDYVVTKT